MNIRMCRGKKYTNYKHTHTHTHTHTHLLLHLLLLIMQHKHPLPLIDIRQVNRPVRIHHITRQFRPIPGQQIGQIHNRTTVHKDDAADVIVAFPQGAEDGGGVCVARDRDEGVGDVVGSEEVREGTTGTETINVGGDEDEDGAGAVCVCVCVCVCE